MDKRQAKVSRSDSKLRLPSSVTLKRANCIWI